jgi:hypothetical protein
VATSSPPRKKVHTPRASSVSAITTSARKDNRDKSTAASSALFPVAENRQSQFNSLPESSPSKSSPSRSPLSKVRGKDRPPLPQFDLEQQNPDSTVDDTTGMEATQTGHLGSTQLARGRLSPSPSPTPPSRTQSNALILLGHGRRPPSRAGATGEMSNVERMRRAATGGVEGHRSLHHDEARHPRLQSITGSHSDTPPSRIGLDLSLGPRTARAFAAAGVLDGGPMSAPSNKVTTWRSSSVMGYRRDGVERDFGNTSGARSLASSPIPMPGVLGPSGAAARRLTSLHEREQGADVSRTRAASDAWSRPIFTRTPEPSSRNLNMGGAATDPSATSSPTSTGNPRTTLSSSTSSGLAPFELKSFRSSTTTVETNTSTHQAAIQNLKERHELEKEALLSALSEAKKESRVERAAKEELTLELTEMGVYVEELETKLGEAIARMRWMEKEIGILKDAIGVSKVRLLLLTLAPTNSCCDPESFSHA